MPNLKWSKLNSIQLGRYGEYYAKMEFSSYGFYVYTTEVDDHGIDFVVKTPSDDFLEIQVKSFTGSNYVPLRQSKFIIRESLYLCYLRFTEGQLPSVYIIPSTAWLSPNPLFVDHCDYNPPEYGMNPSQKNLSLLEPYSASNFFSRFEDSVLEK